MKSKDQNFPKINPEDFPNLVNYKIGIVVSEWNIDITSNLLKGAKDKLIELGLKSKNKNFPSLLNKILLLPPKLLYIA